MENYESGIDYIYNEKFIVYAYFSSVVPRKIEMLEI